MATNSLSIDTTVKGFLALAMLALALGAFQFHLATLRGDRHHSVPSDSEVRAVKTTTGDKDDVSSCPNGSELSKPIVLNFAQVKAFDNKRLHEMKEYTEPSYEPFLVGPAGAEHHTLLHYLATHYSELPDSTCPRRHLTDIGTRYVASALAMASALPTHPKVYTFDIPSSMERANAFRGKTENEWQAAVKALQIDITFHNLDLLTVSDVDFRRYMNTWLIMLDTFHEPYSVPFEREWIKRLVDAKFFKGILLLDDIHMNTEMKKWWKELKENADRDGYIVYDITKVGHASGTGLLDFSGGQVTVIDNL